MSKKFNPPLVGLGFSLRHDIKTDKGCEISCVRLHCGDSHSRQAELHQSAHLAVDVALNVSTIMFG